MMKSKDEMPESPLVRLDKEGLHIISSEVAEELERKKISPSAITGIDSCPAKWAAETFVTRKIIEQEPDNAARRGSMFHKVMEDFFALPKEERKKEKISQIAKETLLSDDFKDLSQIPEAVQWLKTAIKNYYEMGGKPENVTVAEIERDGKKIPGLEVFVMGNIGNAKRKTLGYIDRLIVDPKKDDGSIILEDWKSGGKAKRWNPKNKSTDGLAEARQQIIYSLLLKNEGIKVSSARLIFPVAKEIVTVDLEDQKMIDRVINDVEETDVALDTYIENNTFEYKPQFLCSWCPLSRGACPVAFAANNAKARDARSKQPTMEDLMPGIEFA